MQMFVAKESLDISAQHERRDVAQKADRALGFVVACNGARATIATESSVTTADLHHSWAIGKMISINLGTSRVACMVYQIHSPEKAWKTNGVNAIHVEVEFLGAVVDLPDGRTEFRRGISDYPHLGAPAHRIRQSDLQQIFDLGARSTISVGTISQDDQIPASISIDDMLKKHFAVLGTTGVGKSGSVSVLLRRTIEARKGLRILILDPHNEYSAAFPDNSVTVEASSLDLPFWLFKFEEFVDVLYRGRKSIEEECDILRELITLAKAKYRSAEKVEVTSTLLKRPISISGQGSGSANTSEAPSPYRMLDLFALIDEILGQLEPRFSRVHLRALRVRLDALQNDPRYTFMFKGAMGADTAEPIISHVFRIPDMGRPITVFQLASLPSEVINAVASVLARMAFDLAMYSGGQYEILVVCEEAHRYVPENQAQGFAPTRAAIAKIAKEGRKYGCYLAVVTQRPGELDPTILSQCSTVFAMRLSNERDQGIIRAAIGDASASTIAFLSAIGNREAIVFGEGVSTTMRMRFETMPRHLLPSAHGLTAGTSWTNGQATREISARDILARMRSVGGEGIV